MQQKWLLELWPGTKQSLHIKGNKIHYLHFGFFCVNFWLGAVRDLTVDMLLGPLTTFEFILGIVSSECRVVPYHSHLEAVLSTDPHQKPATLQDVAHTIENNHVGHVVCRRSLMISHDKMFLSCTLNVEYWLLPLRSESTLLSLMHLKRVSKSCPPLMTLEKISHRNHLHFAI